MKGYPFYQRSRSTSLHLRKSEKDDNILNDWNPGIWVLIWKYSARVIYWILKWQGSVGFQKSLPPCAFDISSLSISRVKMQVKHLIDSFGYASWKYHSYAVIKNFLLSHVLRQLDTPDLLFNPLILTAPKSSLAILMIFCRQKQIQENIWWGNVNQNITYNSPSNILVSHSQFQSYCEKYHRSKRKFRKNS